MPLSRIVDCVGFTTSTTGTGSVTVGSVITDATNGDYLLPGDVGISTAIPCSYRIVQGDALNNFEIGRGTISSTTLTRGTVTRSKIAGTAGTTALTLGGTSKCYIVTLGADLDDTIYRCLAADVAGVNSTAVQSIFGTLTAITLTAATVYDMEMILGISRGTGTTSHTTSLSFTGTATMTSMDYLVGDSNPTTNSSSGVFDLWATSAGALVVIPATATTEHSRFRIAATVRVNAGGTFIPNFTYSVAPGAAPNILRGTKITLTPWGTNTDTAKN